MTNKLYLTIITLSISLVPISAGNRMSLDDVIHAARHQSVKALEARQAFISTYWAYRSYKASRLPSVYLRGNIMSFDRSLNLLQNPDGTGIGLSLSRQIMHLHNGSLTLTRSDEKLTVFTLTFR